MRAHLPTAAALALAGALALPSAGRAAHDHAPSTTKVAASTPEQARLATHDALRDLWVEHVFWARNYVLASRAGDAAQKKVAVEQVLVNAKGISDAVAGFYGKDAGARMLELLAGHWGPVQAYSDATFAGRTEGQEKALAALFANAKEISSFLASANPHLPEDAVLGLLSAHGAHHVQQIQQVRSGDFAAEAATWSAMRAHVHGIADALSDALGKQFPGKA